MKKAPALAVSLLIVLFGTGCANFKLPPSRALPTLRVPPLTVTQPETNFWHGDEARGPASITVDLSDQQAYFLKGKTVVGQSRISTGRRGFQTPPGSYKVIQKDADHVSNLYGDYVNSAGEVVRANIGVNTHKRPPGTKFRGAKMPYFMRIKAGYGMHAGFLPGYPASHGCIRMPHDMAAHFFHAARYGTPVRVRH